MVVRITLTTRMRSDYLIRAEFDGGLGHDLDNVQAVTCLDSQSDLNTAWDDKLTGEQTPDSTCSPKLLTGFDQGICA